jgi:hypothetical protein
VAFSLVVTSLPLGAVQAAMVGTDALIEPATPSTAATTVDAQRAHIQSLLERDDVQRELARLGLAPDEAKARIAAMTPAEVSRLAGRLEQLPAGQGGLIGAVVGLSIFVFLVLLDAFGAVDFFNFVCGGINDPCPGSAVAYPAPYPPPPPPPPAPYPYPRQRYFQAPPAPYYEDPARGGGRYYDELTPPPRPFR